MSVVLYDDATARDFAPFSLTRPGGELRAGAELVRARWARVLGAAATGFVSSAHLEAFEEFDAPPAATGDLAAGTWVVNTRCAVALDERVATAAGATGAVNTVRVGGRVAAVRLRDPLPVSALRGGTFALDRLAGDAEVVCDGWWLDAVWDLIAHLGAMLADDASALMPATRLVPAHLTVLGAHDVHVEPGAAVEPLVVADATAGPILVRRGAQVQAFTRLVGPCVIGEDAVVSGGRVAACSIGDRAKVNGEISVSILVGHCNKGHDGFVGHSVIGRWANLGAGTITSNLKNSYGPVALWTPSGQRATGQQFLGAMIGDHAKTGIGSRLTTGCVIGAGANVFGSAMVPKVVPPFAWGEAPDFARFAADKFLEVAERVMARRGVALGAGMRACLTAARTVSGAAADR